MKAVKHKVDQWDCCANYQLREMKRKQKRKHAPRRENVEYSHNWRKQRLYIEIDYSQEAHLSSTGRTMILAQWVGSVPSIAKGARISLHLFRKLNNEEKLQREIAGNILTGGKVYETDGTAKVARDSESHD